MRISPLLTCLPVIKAALRRCRIAAAPPLGLLLASLLLASLLLTTGCAVQVTMPELAPQHPANPTANATPLPAPSPLLDSYRHEVPTPEELPAMDHSGHGMAMGGMEHGEAGAMDPEAMGHDAMEDEAMEDEAMDHHAMDHDAMDHGAMKQDAMDHDSVDDEAMEDDAPEHDAMDHDAKDDEAADDEGGSHEHHHGATAGDGR